MSLCGFVREHPLTVRALGAWVQRSPCRQANIAVDTSDWALSSHLWASFDFRLSWWGMGKSVFWSEFDWFPHFLLFFERSLSDGVILLGCQRWLALWVKPWCWFILEGWLILVGTEDVLLRMWSQLGRRLSPWVQIDGRLLRWKASTEAWHLVLPCLLQDWLARTLWRDLRHWLDISPIPCVRLCMHITGTTCDLESFISSSPSHAFLPHRATAHSVSQLCSKLWRGLRFVHGMLAFGNVSFSGIRCEPSPAVRTLDQIINLRRTRYLAGNRPYLFEGGTILFHSLHLLRKTDCLDELLMLQAPLCCLLSLYSTGVFPTTWCTLILCW